MKYRAKYSRFVLHALVGFIDGDTVSETSVGSCPPVIDGTSIAVDVAEHLTARGGYIDSEIEIRPFHHVGFFTLSSAAREPSKLFSMASLLGLDAPGTSGGPATAENASASGTSSESFAVPDCK